MCGAVCSGVYAMDVFVVMCVVVYINTYLPYDVQVVSKMWKYIKEHDLQDPKDRRSILCDKKMQDVFATPKYVLLVL